ncbi:invasion associated locus B family protein [Brevirhabdus sp.]|uniref:invasion associated locus B family protein n=1 Tax=Brevirhabdus sp. TaxID=2004514 RepID=UPI00405A051A
MVGFAVVASTPTMAQDSSNRVAAKTDWSVFVEDSPKECWIVSAPKETVNTRDGKVVAVRRGDIRLFVSFRPGSNVDGEISFKSGYPFAKGSTVKMQVGNESYDLFTSSKDETAWPPSPAADSKISKAMMRGADAVLSAVSGRGTKTRDTFSLMGFTAALEEARKRCK